MNKETLVYIISPVRQVTADKSEVIAKHAAFLKETGARVFNPVEDAPQDDATGYNIVMSELNFMYKAALQGGRIDILWNVGGKPSEGSRVDFGIAYALGLNPKLVAVFNENEPTGPQETFQLIKDLSVGIDSSRIRKLNYLHEKMWQKGKATVDWDIVMEDERQEWQRIILGLALGCMIQDPDFKIKRGLLIGEEPEGKCYPKVIKEIEKRQDSYALSNS